MRPHRNGGSDATLVGQETKSSTTLLPQVGSCCREGVRATLGRARISAAGAANRSARIDQRSRVRDGSGIVTERRGEVRSVYYRSRASTRP
ncbi:MAG TPA: hypothetical protein DCQ98_00655, partial [Planctomycetaceae bacterium]|nr:hypothetical protein [Planctomycetaceae bacterium]